MQTTLPGQEIRDALVRQTLRNQRLAELEGQPPEPTLPGIQQPTTDTIGNKVELPSDVPVYIRRFHLARTGLRLSPLRSPSGLRRHKLQRKDQLATFIEKTGRVDEEKKLQRGKTDHARALLGGTGSFKYPPPEDRITGICRGSHEQATVLQVSKATAKDTSPPQRIGSSMQDHPSTWDHDSDQLADELAVFALQLSDDGAQKTTKTREVNTPKESLRLIEDDQMDIDDDYVYETYVRIHRDDATKVLADPPRSIGVLVIEDQDDELWQTYGETDEDTDWDEEDADSNGM